jgi:hypothetical protein
LKSVFEIPILKWEPTKIVWPEVFSTSTSTVRRPAFKTIVPSPSRHSPGFISSLLSWPDRPFNVQHARAIAEQTLNFDCSNQFSDALQNIILGEGALSDSHDLLVRSAATGCFVHLVADERQRFGMGQFPAFGVPPAG